MRLVQGVSVIVLYTSNGTFWSGFLARVFEVVIQELSICALVVLYTGICSAEKRAV